MSLGSVGQTFEAIATFENGHQSFFAVPGGEFFHKRCQVGEVLIGEQELSKRVAGSGVKSGRDQEQIRLEIVDGRHEVLLESPQNLLPAGPSRERTVYCFPQTGPLSLLPVRSCARVPR